MNDWSISLPSRWECFVDMEFNELKKVLELSEKSLGEDLENFRKWYEEEQKKVHTEREEALEDYVRPILDEKEAMIGVIRTSLFTLCFALLENFLNDFCDEYQRKRKLSINFKDMGGKGIKRAMLYLKKVIGLTLDNTKEWQEIALYSDIRNCILHNGSIASSNSVKQLRLYEKKNHSIMIDERNRISFKKDFCFESICKVKSFLLNLPSPYEISH